MLNEITHVDIDSNLEQLDLDIRELTGNLFELVEGDRLWWEQNLEKMVGQPLASLNYHLDHFGDDTLSRWRFTGISDIEFSLLDPIEALVWLVGLCNLDRLLLHVLPREFTEEVLLQWRVLSMYWLG